MKSSICLLNLRKSEMVIDFSIFLVHLTWNDPTAFRVGFRFKVRV